jgi:predicted Zn finger-like uncharacterized protein
VFTLCPYCGTVHPVNAKLLATARGRVRCGQCRQAFDALDQLYDDRPRRPSRETLGGATGRAPESDPPVLQPGAAPLSKGPAGMPKPTSREPVSWPWLAALAALLLLTVGNLGWSLREHLPADSSLAQGLHGLGIPGFDSARLATATPGQGARMHLVSRDLHAHPTRPGVLVLSATFVNLSDKAHPYPHLSLVLLDQDSRPLLGRSFEPAEYLAASDGNALLAPDLHVPVLLEFADPGEKAVGFEIVFH